MVRMFLLALGLAILGIATHAILSRFDALFWVVILFACLAFGGGWWLGRQGKGR